MIALFLLVTGAAVSIFVTTNQEPDATSAAQDDPHSEKMIAEIQELQSMLESNPGDTAALLRLANIYYDVQFFHRAIPLYGRYLEAIPSNPDARVDLGTSYFNLSLTDSTGSDRLLTEAEASFKKALEYAPEHLFAHFNLGIISLHKGDIAEAKRWLEECVRLDPDSEAGRRSKQLLDQHKTS